VGEQCCVPPVGAVPAVQAPPSVPGFVPELEPDDPELEPDEPELERPPELELEPELEPEEPELDVDEPELEPEIPELDVDEPELEPDEPELEPAPELPDAAPDPPELEPEPEPEPLDGPGPESEPQLVSEGGDEHAANATTAAVGNRRERTLMTGTLLAWCSGIRPAVSVSFLRGTESDDLAGQTTADVRTTRANASIGLWKERLQTFSRTHILEQIGVKQGDEAQAAQGG
jgi:hypothetical protein